MHTLDLAVLGGYFLVMIAIGVWASRRIAAQEDFFMGGRGFGKLLQTFAAFGAGTGSSDPVNAARTTVTDGLSGMWSVMYWLFVTPFYWITGVWYRRMRHLTLGDWFVERYQSKALGAAYALFGLLFMIVYGSMLFSAIGKVAAPIIEADTVTLWGREIGIEYVLVPVIGVVVLAYGIAGGLRAAYFTDLVQGICIIVLSIILIPYGLEALVRTFGQPGDGLTAGFRILHERLPPESFHLVGSTSSSEFPLHRLLAVVVLNLIGVVVQPHFIATGGGSAKTETTARVGLVLGNFLKRFCTVGWVLTGLIALALYADHPDLARDADFAWGVASRELLGPGLTGLMLACLLAALMSSVDAYMVVGSGLVVRNLYAAYVRPDATEREYVRVARITGFVIVGGAVVVSLSIMNVFQQLQLTWKFPILFASIFWVGMFWRRATAMGAWITIAFCAGLFFLAPPLLPTLLPGLREDPGYAETNATVVVETTRSAARSDVARRAGTIRLWDETAPELRGPLGPRPEPLALGDPVTERRASGGKAVYWSGGVAPRDAAATKLVVSEEREGSTLRRVLEWPEGAALVGQGDFQAWFLIYHWLGVDLSNASDALLQTLDLPPMIVLPFLVLILASLVTRRVAKEPLDRYYAKMRTPVHPDPVSDRARLEEAYRDPARLESLKLLPGSSFEFGRPRVVDIVGFVVSVAVCFAIVGLAVFVAGLGS